MVRILYHLVQDTKLIVTDWDGSCLVNFLKVATFMLGKSFSLSCRFCRAFIPLVSKNAKDSAGELYKTFTTYA